MRSAYMRMLLRLSYKLDNARMALLMSVADLYFEPDRDEDKKLLDEILQDHPKERVKLMELMPAWKRWGYEEGIQEGLEKGKAEGKAEGKVEGMAEERAAIVRRMLAKGFTPGQVVDTLEIPLTEVEKLSKH